MNFRVFSLINWDSNQRMKFGIFKECLSLWSDSFGVRIRRRVLVLMKVISYGSFVLLLLPRFLVEEVRVSRVSCDFFSLSIILLLILPFPFANYIESCDI